MNQIERADPVFNQFSSSYDSWFDDPKGSFIDRIETELAFRLLQVEPGMKVLDIGCGTGNFSIKLAKMGCQVTGVDISDEMLRLARSKAGNQGLDIEFVCMDILGLAFADDSFHAVVSMAAFEFIPDVPKAFAEMLRVVRPAGQVLVGTIAGDSAWGELYSSVEFQKQSVFKYANFMTIRDLTGLDPKRLVATGECLFIDPQADESEFNIVREQELAGSRKGGVICGLWKKQQLVR